MEDRRGHLEHISRDLKNPPRKDTAPALNEERAEDGEYRCPSCHDFGFVHPRENGKIDYTQIMPCVCVKADLEGKRARNLLRYCELPPGSQHMTFENFKLRPELQEVYDLAVDLGEGGEITWLTMMCGSQRGKTHLAIAIVRRWLQRGIPARYVHVPLLLEELRRGFRKEADDSYEARFDRFLKVPLLLLDDLGTESRTPWVREKLDIIVDYRLMNDLALVVTTNTPWDELPFRIASRLDRLPGSRVVHIDVPEYEKKDM